MSYMIGLQCKECGHRVPVSPVYVCDACFGPYEGEDDYDFGSYLIMYDYRRKTTHELTDRDAAIELFKAADRDERCPPGGEGVGVRVF